MAEHPSDDKSSISNIEQSTSTETETTPQSVKNKPRSTWVNRISDILIEQWFLLALGILIAIASQVQVPNAQQKLKQTVTSYVCISIIFFVYVRCSDPISAMEHANNRLVRLEQDAFSTPKPYSKTTAGGKSTSSYKSNAF